MTLLLALLLLAPAGAAHHGAALFLESQAALLTGDLDKAGELALASVKADPASPTLRVALAEIQVQQGAIQGAKASLAEALRMDPDHAEALGLLGVLAAMQGSLNEAEGLLRRAHAVRNDEESALRLAGLLGEMGRDGEAEVVLSPWDGPSALRGLARLRLARDDYAGAAEALRRVLDYAPGDPETLITLSRALEETGDMAGAAQAAEQAGAYKVSRGGALRLASLLRRSGECPRALEVLDDQGLDTPQADEERTQCLIRLGRWEEARGVLGRLQGGAPDAFFPRFLLLRLDIMEGRGEAARAALADLERSAPGESVAGLLALERALLDRLEGQSALAERALLRLLDDPETFDDASVNLIELYRASQCRGRALETAEAMARRSPEDPRLLMQVLWALLDADDIESAALYLDHLREAHGPDGWRDGGWALVEHGHPERGLQAAEAWAAAWGPSREARFLRAGALEKMGRVEEALAEFRALVRDHPDDATLLNFLGYTLVERGMDAREALPLLQKAALLTPLSGAVWDSLGWARYALGEWEEARAALLKASRLEPLEATILRHLADAEARLGMHAEAEIHRRQAFALECGP